MLNNIGCYWPHYCRISMDDVEADKTIHLSMYSCRVCKSPDDHLPREREGERDRETEREGERLIRKG